MNSFQRMLSCLLLVLLAGCAGLTGGDPAPTATPEAAALVNIQCTAAYRKSVTVEIEAETYVYHPASGAELQFWCTAE